MWHILLKAERLKKTLKIKPSVKAVEYSAEKLPHPTER